MNTVFVFNACSPFLQTEINELNHFQQNYYQKDSVQAWVICKEIVKLPNQIEQLTMRDIQVIQVADDTDEEEILHALLHIYTLWQPKCIIFPSDMFGKALATRLAMRTNGTSCQSVIACEEKDTGFIINKPVYANNLIATFRMKRKPYCLSIAQMTNQKEWQPSSHSLNIIAPLHDERKKHVLSSEFQPIKVDVSLESAEKVLAIGRGIKSQEQLSELEKQAKQIGYEIGVSRPIAMNGWIEMSRLIGASGKMISPRVCIAAGVSGSQAFSVGIRDSDLIVSINQDEYAPIHKIADVAIIDDYHAVLKALFPLMSTTSERGKGS